MLTALLATAIFFGATLVHATFACATAAHGQRATHHAQGHGCKDTGPPPCCQQPGSTVVLQKSAQPTDDARLVGSFALAPFVLPNVASTTAYASLIRERLPARSTAGALRTHLFLQNLLL